MLELIERLMTRYPAAAAAAAAAQHGDANFARVRPPLIASGPDHAEAIAKAVHIATDAS